MPRRRMITPEIWADRKLMETSFMAQVLFIGMFSNADDEGRLRADVKDLKRTVFGYRDESLGEIEAALDELRHACKSLAIYTIDGERYAAFVKWEEYQYVQRPTKSKLPPPPPSDNERNGNGALSDDSAKAHGGLTEDSRSDIALIEKNRNKSKKTPFGSGEKSAAPADPGPEPEPERPKPPRPGVDLFRDVFARFPTREFFPRFEAALASVGQSLMRRRLEEWRDKPGCAPTNYADMLDVVVNGWRADGGGARRANGANTHAGDDWKAGAI